MLTIILSNILTSTLAWLAQPQTIMGIIAFIAGLPKIYQTIMTAKGSNFYDKAMEVAKIEATEVAYMQLSDEEKFNRVVASIFAVFPKEAKFYEPMVKEIAHVAYHAFIKPNLDKLKPME